MKKLSGKPSKKPRYGYYKIESKVSSSIKLESLRLYMDRRVANKKF